MALKLIRSLLSGWLLSDSWDTDLWQMNVHFLYDLVIWPITFLYCLWQHFPWSFDYWHKSSRLFRRIMIVNIRNCILAFSVFKSVSLVSIYVNIKIDIYRLFLWYKMMHFHSRKESKNKYWCYLSVVIASTSVSLL